MRATILRELPLAGLPSASGIEILNSTVYVIGDDSPLLYCLDAGTLVQQRTIPLFTSSDFDSGRIPKKRKPDLECLTTLTDPDGRTGLFVAGSGSRPQRELGFWVTLEADGGAGVQPLNLQALYAQLRPHLPEGVKLNLEAAAATATELLLFQRAVGAEAGHVLFRLPLAATWRFVLDSTQPAPAVRAQHYALPSLDGQPAGFSGAALFEGQLFLTASVENTDDPILDGKVVGSLLGLLPLADLSQAPTLVPLTLPDGQPYHGKVESLAVVRTLAPGQWEVILVTDDDQGGSTAVVVELTA